MKGIVLGTGGHVDHGKTALVRALTGVDTDRWEEERRRGLTIDIGFAHLSLSPALEAGIVDVPGHEAFLKNMLAGATGIDLLLLVVAADEGPMPQTLEHLSIARLLGVRRGISVLTKTDKVERPWLDLVREEVRREVRSALDGAEWPTVAVSSVTGEGLAELRDVILREAEESTERPAEDLFRLPVDRSFSVRGMGTVVTGTVWSGAVSTGDFVRLMPSGSRVRVRSLQVHGDARKGVRAGRRCALALAAVEPREVPRGTMVVKEEGWKAVHRVGARLELLPRARPLEQGQRVRIYHGTREVMARVFLAIPGPLASGEECWALLRLEEPLVLRVSDRLVVRFYSPVTTVGGGEVAELDPPRRWRERQETWERLLVGRPEEKLRSVLRLRRGVGISWQEIPLATGMPRGELLSLRGTLPGDVLCLGDLFLLRDDLDDSRRYILGKLGQMHKERPRSSWVPKETLRAAACRRFASPLVNEALEALVDAGELVLEGPRVSLPGHGPGLADEELVLKETLAARIHEGGREPPTVEELERAVHATRDVLNDLLVLLKEEGRVVPLTPELYVSAETAGELEACARTVLAERRVASPALFKEAFGVTRKYLIPALEYLDRVGVTRRTGEGRELVG